MEDGRVDRAFLKDYGELVVGGSAGTNAGTSYTVDIESGNVFNLILNSATCTLTFSNPFASGTATSFSLFLVQDATGSRTVTWPSSVIWPDGTEPTLTNIGEDMDVFTFITLNGGAQWFGITPGSVNVTTPDLAYTHTATGWDGGNNSTHTFTDAAIGTASVDRHVIVSIMNRESGAGSAIECLSVTIGGNAATEAIQYRPNQAGMSIWYLKVTSGTTATVVGTFATTSRAICHVGIITGKFNLQVIGTVQNNGASPVSVTPSIATGQLCVLAAGADQGDAAITWTNATEQAETAAAGENNLSTAIREDSGATVDASYSGGGSSRSAVGVTFG